MSRAWRVMTFIVLALLAAGIVLLGAAWLTGASPDRIVELVFDGREGLDAWLRAGLDSARSICARLLELARSLI